MLGGVAGGGVVAAGGGLIGSGACATEKPKERASDIAASSISRA